MPVKLYIVQKSLHNRATDYRSLATWESLDLLDEIKNEFDGEMLMDILTGTMYGTTEVELIEKGTI